MSIRRRLQALERQVQQPSYRLGRHHTRRRRPEVEVHRRWQPGAGQPGELDGAGSSGWTLWTTSRELVGGLVGVGA
jgi:hypothetical protein